VPNPQSLPLPEPEIWLCPVHQSLEDSGALEPFNNCVACLRAERNELKQMLQEAKAEAATALDFLETELGWECFREEFFPPMDGRVSTSAKNADLLRAYLAEKGHAVRFLAEMRELREKVSK
jgi:hypothetical protein